jgi:hypothetical protein
MTFRGTKSAIGTVLSSVTFNPTPDFSGSTWVEITTKDLGRTGLGGTQTDTDRVNIYVNNTPDPVTVTNPGAMSQTYVGISEGTGSVDFTNIVLSDPDIADIITVTLTLRDPIAGSLTTPSGSSYDAQTGVWTISSNVATVNNALRDVVFVQAENWYSSTSIAIDVKDTGGNATPVSTGTISVTIVPVPDPPAATIPTPSVSFHPASVDAGHITPFTLGITVSDGDDAGFGGPFGATENVTVTVRLLNPAAGWLTGGVDVWSFTGTVAAANAALAGLQYFPEPPHSPPFTGVAEIRVDISDGTYSVSDLIRIGVAVDVNNPPAPPATSEPLVQPPPSPSMLAGDVMGTLVSSLVPEGSMSQGAEGRESAGAERFAEAAFEQGLDSSAGLSWQEREAAQAAQVASESEETPEAPVVELTERAAQEEGIGEQKVGFEDFAADDPKALAAREPHVVVFNMAQMTVMDALSTAKAGLMQPDVNRAISVGTYLSQSLPPLPLRAGDREALAAEKAEAVLWDNISKGLPGCTRCDDLVEAAVQVFQ